MYYFRQYISIFFDNKYYFVIGLVMYQFDSIVGIVSLMVLVCDDID